MNIIKALLLVSTVASVSLALDISGTVTDTGGSPLEGAVVWLEEFGYSDTTGADGKFSLTGVGINNYIQSPRKLSVRVGSGILFITATEKSPVEISTFNLHGRMLSKVNKVVEVGSHSMALPHAGAGVYIYKVTSGSSELVLKSCSIVPGGKAKSSNNLSNYDSQVQVKSTRLFDDVIKVTKPGYLNNRITIASPDTSGMEIKLISQDAGTVTDIDGNIYHAIRIGTQIWTVENLRTTKYNDGTAIPYVTDTATWANLTTPGYCYYNNDSAANAEKYGALYNWHAVNTGKLASAGWHVPTDAEWEKLQNYLIANGYNWDGTTTGNKIGKSVAAKTDWITSLEEGYVGNDLSTNNSSGFSALPGGYRGPRGGFELQGGDGTWGGTTENGASNAYNCAVFNYDDGLYGDFLANEFGFFVRLVRE